MKTTLRLIKFFSELERKLRSKLTLVGLHRARLKGLTFGRPNILNDDIDLNEIKDLLDEGVTHEEIYKKHIPCSSSTFYRFLQKHNLKSKRGGKGKKK